MRGTTPAGFQDQLKKLPARLDTSLHAYNFSGLVFAVAFFCLSLFPSLLPRSWFFQGLLSGIAIAVGYGIGTFVSFAVRWLFERDVLTGLKRYAWRMLYAVGALLVAAYLILGTLWQDQLRMTLHVAPLERPYGFLVCVLTILVGIGCLKLGRSIRRLYLWALNKIDIVMPRRISIVLGVIVVWLFITWVVSGAFITSLGVISSLLFSHKNHTTPEGINQPADPSRSGSKGSLVPWNTLGYQGQAFVGSGPTAQQLQTFSGTAPKQPIRIYVGVDSAPDAYERAELAVKEMHRAGAFDRKVLVIAIPTGTGWLNPQSVDALEYIHNGDTATVAEQYSYLPSWISFLVDKQKAQDTGKALYDAVYAEWSSLPQDRRPELLMYGLSLGAFGGQAAFSGPSAMVHSVDGALWQGTPGDTELWKEITRRRDAGSPEWQPVIDNSATIRFASQNPEIVSNQQTWDGRRVLYVQHGSDPIVWFNFDLPFHKPDWLSEARAPDVLDNTIWVPVVTFFQLAADQVVGMSVPKDAGHNYETTVVDSWAAISRPANWNEAKADKLQALINKY